MDRNGFRIPEESKCARWILACGAVMLLMQVLWLGVSLGRGGLEWEFEWMPPLRLHADKSYLKCQINDLAVPILMVVLGMTYAKKDLELLSLPLICEILGAVSWMLLEIVNGVLDYWNSSEWLLRHFLKLAPLGLLLLAFALTLSGRLKRKIWLLLIGFGYPAFLAGRILLNLIRGLASGAGYSLYLSTFFGAAAFYLAYGVLGLAMSDDPDRSYLRVGERIGLSYGEEDSRYVANELLEEKNITNCVLLSSVTLKIYSWFWAYSIMKKIRYLKGEDTSCGGEMLCYLLIPFYEWYWFYTRGGKLADGAKEYGICLPKRQGIYLLAFLFTDQRLPLAMMQSDLNEFARLYREALAERTDR